MAAKVGHGYYIFATLTCLKPIFSRNIMFRIDTGCDITTVNPYDNRYLGIDFTTLQPAIPSIGANGELIESFSIANCALIFTLYKSMHSELLDNIFLARPQITETNRNTIFGVPSLLGLDFLKRYSMKFEDNFVILEK